MQVADRESIYITFTKFVEVDYLFCVAYGFCNWRAFCIQICFVQELEPYKCVEKTPQLPAAPPFHSLQTLCWCSGGEKWFC